MSQPVQLCPICGVTQPENRRYPDHLCPACAGRAVAADGRPLQFSNLSISGGFLARYADDQSEYDSHICFVDGRRCWADEDYWGGIVIRPSEAHG